MTVPPISRRTPLTPDDARAIYRMGEDAVMRALVALSERVAELEGQTAKHSGNSSKPPGSDGIRRQRRPYAKRARSGRKPGGQVGHPGSTLRMTATPDAVERHVVSRCSDCNRSLAGVAATIEKRQVFDIPPVSLIVTEHQAERKVCPHCGTQNRAPFPDGVPPGATYGRRFQALAVYLQHQQLLPYERTADLLEDLFGVRPSVGTLAGFQRRCAERVRPAEDMTHALLRRADQILCDETGAHCNADLHWVHTTSHPALTHYGFDAGRGQDAIRRIGILPHFSGRVMHDHLPAYFIFDCEHILCNAHHLRELRFVGEVCGERWAKQLHTLLRKMYVAVQKAVARGATCLSVRQRQRYRAAYRRVIACGERLHRRLGPPVAASRVAGKRGRKKQRPGKNLLDRLKQWEAGTLAFINDFTVPFTNNLAERDLRMVKVKMNISGGFRNPHAAASFFRIRGYLSTARKQDWNIMEATIAAVRGSPFIPVLSPPILKQTGFSLSRE